MTLKEIILSDMDNNLTDLEKARYIYLKLGEKVSFSTKFQNTSEEMFAKMYHPDIDINKYNFNQVNCVMWASIYSQLLNSVGIDNKIVGEGHKYVSFEANDEVWVADATIGKYTDLSRIKNNDLTSYFGISRFPNNKKLMSSIDYDKSAPIIEKIDKKLEYKNNKTDELNKLRDFLDSIRTNQFDITKIIENPNESDIVTLKLEYLFERLGTLSDGYYEAKDFVKHLEYYILNDDEKEKVHATELKRTNKNKEVDIIQCIYVQDNENNYNYYLLAPNKKIRKVNEEEIIGLSIFGFGLEEDEKIKGIDYPKNFTPGKVSSKKSMFLSRISKYKDVINDISDYNVIQGHTIK